VTLAQLAAPARLTLLARRSRFYAGARYLKRGADDHGHAANEVESEQILDDTRGGLAAFLQLRASVPVHWMQRTSVAMPRPPILMQPRDVTYAPARAHAAGLLQQPAARGQQHVLRWAILFALFLRSLKDFAERVLGGAQLALIEVLLRVLQQHLELVGVVLRAQRATADEERREHELRDEAQPTHVHRRTIGPRRARVERRRVRCDYCSPYSRILR
jgi:hypothetical protein